MAARTCRQIRSVIYALGGLVKGPYCRSHSRLGADSGALPPEPPTIVRGSQFEKVGPGGRRRSPPVCESRCEHEQELGETPETAHNTANCNAPTEFVDGTLPTCS